MLSGEYRTMFEAEGSHWWYVSLHELIRGLVQAERRRKGPLAVLDAGCGTGRLCEVLAPFGSVAGCDRSDLAVRFCGQRGLRNIVPADLNTADLGRERYDVVTSIDVLYHRDIGDELAVLRRLFNALRPGGLLVLQVPAFQALRSTHDDAVQTRRRYTRPEVAALLRSAGFRLELATYRVSLLFPAIAVLRLGRRLIAAGGGTADARSDTRLPGAAMNRLLLGIMRFEDRLLRVVRLPFGTSVFALGRRPAQEAGA